MRRARHTARIAAALLAASAIASPAHADKADNSVRFAFEQTLNSSDPWFSNLAISAYIAEQVWESLIYRDPRTGAYGSGLATAWRWIDETTLELDLRQDGRFHDGTSFDADDVVATIDFVTKPENGADRELVRWIDHAEMRGRYTVRLVTRGPSPASIAYLAAPRFVIQPSQHYRKPASARINAVPIGTGPYRAVEYVPGKHIRFQRNRDYMEGGPKGSATIEKVEIRFIPDQQTRVAEMVAGGLDLITYVPRDQAHQLREIARLEILPTQSTRYAYLKMSTLQRTPAPQLLDQKVRQAIMHAIDRETMVKFLVEEGADVLHAECHPSQFGCPNLGVPRYEYDPEKARRLLAEAGYPNGFDIDLYAYRDRNQSEAIVGYLGAVGIRARLRFLQPGAIMTARRAGRAALLHGTWGTPVADASASISAFYEFSPDDVNRDADVRDLLLRADASMDPDIRKAMYAKALALIAERAYALPLYSVPVYYVAAKGLAIKPALDEIPRFYEMSWQ